MHSAKLSPREPRPGSEQVAFSVLHRGERIDQLLLKKG